MCAPHAARTTSRGQPLQLNTLPLRHPGSWGVVAAYRSNEQHHEGVAGGRRTRDTHLCISCVGPPWGPDCHLPFSPEPAVEGAVQLLAGVEEAPAALMLVRCP